MAAESAEPIARPPKNDRRDGLKKLARRDDLRRRRGQRGFDAIAQGRRRGEFQVGAGHRLTHGAERLELRGAAGASRHVGLDIAAVPGVELAVDQRVKQQFVFGAIHHTAPSATFQAARSIDRARASRDITVPTGTPATSAISW